jgi:glycolate oxidase FAD binding subunit
MSPISTPSSDSALDSICARVRTATTERTPLRLRGGGSKDFYGQPMPDASHMAHMALLDTRDLTGVISYEPSELVITARSGTPLTEVEALLSQHGQYLPFEPPHYRWSSGGTASGHGATVGGMVSAGLSGPARATVGSVRDHVLGVNLVNGRGELLRFGGQVIKNVAGYDVSRVVVGALGTLGLIVDVSLKVMPLPLADATLVFAMDQATALATLHRWGAQPLPINASRWADGRLHLRLRGAVAAVEAACARLPADVAGTGHAATSSHSTKHTATQPQRLDNAQAVADWARCRDQQLPFFTPQPSMALWRLSVAQTAPVIDLPWPQLVEWQGAQRWLWAPLSASAQIRAAALVARGIATVFVANNDDNSAERPQYDAFGPLPSPLDRIQRQLQAEFDPAGVFNPGRLTRKV